MLQVLQVTVVHVLSVCSQIVTGVHTQVTPTPPPQSLVALVEPPTVSLQNKLILKQLIKFYKQKGIVFLFFSVPSHF